MRSSKLQFSKHPKVALAVNLLYRKAHLQNNYILEDYMTEDKIIQALEKVSNDLNLAKRIMWVVSEDVFGTTDPLFATEYTQQYTALNNGAYDLVYQSEKVVDALISTMMKRSTEKKGMTA